MALTSNRPHSFAGATERRLEVRPERLVQDWKIADERARAYLGALDVPAALREGLVREAIERALGHEPWAQDGDAVSETMAALRALVMESFPAPPGLEDLDLDEEVAWRLATAAAGAGQPSGAPGGDALPLRDGRFWSTPPLARRGMVPDKFERRFRRPRPEAPAAEPGATVGGRRERRLARRWTRVALRRRFLLGFLVLIPSVVASGFMVNVLPHQGRTWLEFAIVLVFGALFGWISIGFWTALLGFLLLIRRRDRFAVTNLDGAPERDLTAEARTAIVMPICEEPVERVFAGLKAIYRSVERAGGLEHFDFFVLSDSHRPDTIVREEEAWLDWCRETGGFGRIFYRRRKVRLERKAGNVADFCRRWGGRYRYMIMLDADSIMAGETVVRLARLMEAHPEVGMIQTAPTAVNRRSLLARSQQFASRVYGPMFAAGLHFWQLGDGQYWGHNTIIRVAPFMDHCALPRLSGKPPLGGEIMSHDFVEAALMGRAGWELWLAYDLGGSYEEVPSTLLEEMSRDRRWCQGNLQHLRLLFAKGLFGAHRALFLNGVLSYTSALLWLAFLTLSTVEALRNALTEPDYFPHGPSLFPEWPVWRPDWALALLAVTGMILFLPKFLSIALITFKQHNARGYGGFARLTASVLLEILISTLLAPIRMVFHSRFVITNLLGRTVSWGSQGREDMETAWREALRRHGTDSLIASAWGATLFWLDPGYFWWVTPIVGALVLSVPTSVLTSRVALGEAARRRRLFLIPEESDPPAELRDLRELLAAMQEKAKRLDHAADGFVRAALAPNANALHRALLGRLRSLKPDIRAARTALLERALDQGPSVLGDRDKKILLHDPAAVDTLHRRTWGLSDRVRERRWRRPAAPDDES